MHAGEPGTPDMSREGARPPRRFPRPAALGALLVAAGVIMSLGGFGNAWEASIKGCNSGVWGIVFLGGLATMAVGAGIIVWHAVVRARWSRSC